MIRLLAVLLLTLGFCLQASAKVNIKKKKDEPLPNGTYSEDLYLCNLGISHPRQSAPTSGACENPNCESEVITNPMAGTDSLSFELSDRHNNSIDNDVLVSDSEPKVYSSAQTQWFNNITELTVNLSSERYGASYHLDFCYLGPVYETPSKNGVCDKGLKKSNGNCYGQYKNPDNANDPESVDNQNPGNGNGPGGNGNGNGNGNGGSNPLEDLSIGKYSIQTLLGATSRNYIQNSGLQVRSYFVCEYRNNSGPRELTEIAAPGLVLGNSGTPFMNFPSLQMTFYRLLLNSNAMNVPRFCLIRFEFRETSQAPRKNAEDQVEFTVGTDIIKEATDSSWPGLNLN